MTNLTVLKNQNEETLDRVEIVRSLGRMVEYARDQAQAEKLEFITHLLDLSLAELAEELLLGTGITKPVPSTDGQVHPRQSRPPSSTGDHPPL